MSVLVLCMQQIRSQLLLRVRCFALFLVVCVFEAMPGIISLGQRSIMPLETVLLYVLGYLCSALLTTAAAPGPFPWQRDAVPDAQLRADGRHVTRAGRAECCRVQAGYCWPKVGGAAARVWHREWQSTPLTHCAACLHCTS